MEEYCENCGTQENVVDGLCESCAYCSTCEGRCDQCDYCEGKW